MCFLFHRMMSLRKQVPRCWPHWSFITWGLTHNAHVQLQCAIFHGWCYNLISIWNFNIVATVDSTQICTWNAAESKQLPNFLPNSAFVIFWRRIMVGWHLIHLRTEHRYSKHSDHVQNIWAPSCLEKMQFAYKIYGVNSWIKTKSLDILFQLPLFHYKQTNATHQTLLSIPLPICPF